MIQYKKVFYKCLGFKTNIKYNKPLFFYHVPKCAGTTFSVLLSHLVNRNHRISGALFENNDKGGQTAYENYIKNENLINSSNLDFLYGHVPFEIHSELRNDYIFATILREPIQRCISHYVWGLNRGYFSPNEKLADLFNKNKLQKNVLVNQFSGKGLSKPNDDESVDLSYKNLVNSIDFIFDVEETFKLLNLIISSYNFSNLFFQNQQVLNKKIIISDKDIDIIKKHNDKDIILYSRLVKNKIIKNYYVNKNEEREKKPYLYSSPDLLANGKKTILLSEKKIIEIEKKLIDANYQIKEV